MSEASVVFLVVVLAVRLALLAFPEIRCVGALSECGKRPAGDERSGYSTLQVQLAGIFRHERVDPHIRASMEGLQNLECHTHPSLAVVMMRSSHCALNGVRLGAMYNEPHNYIRNAT